MSLFGGLPVIVTLAAQIECVEREIKLRERVYPRWISEGRMTPGKADAELAGMRAVLATVREAGELKRRLSEALQRAGAAEAALAEADEGLELLLEADLALIGGAGACLHCGAPESPEGAPTHTPACPVQKAIAAIARSEGANQ